MLTAPSGKPKPGQPRSHYVRWKFDPAAADGTHVEPTELVALDGEMPQVDARFATKPYTKAFLSLHDPASDKGPVGGIYNAVAKLDVTDGSYEYWSAGDNVALHEVAFVPRSPDGMRASPPLSMDIIACADPAGLLYSVQLLRQTATSCP